MATKRHFLLPDDVSLKIYENLFREATVNIWGPPRLRAKMETGESSDIDDSIDIENIIDTEDSIRVNRCYDIAILLVNSQVYEEAMPILAACLHLKLNDAHLDHISLAAGEKFFPFLRNISVKGANIDLGRFPALRCLTLLDRFQVLTTPVYTEQDWFSAEMGKHDRDLAEKARHKCLKSRINQLALKYYDPSRTFNIRNNFGVWPKHSYEAFIPGEGKCYDGFVSSRSEKHMRRRD